MPDLATCFCVVAPCWEPFCMCVLSVSPKPTLEEVRSWGQSFDKLMCCPAGRNSFRQFLRTEFSEENMLFWLACDEFSKEANKSVVEEKARGIYEDYISILSPKEVRRLSISALLLKLCWFQGWIWAMTCPGSFSRSLTFCEMYQLSKVELLKYNWCYYCDISVNIRAATNDYFCSWIVCRLLSR